MTVVKTKPRATVQDMWQASYERFSYAASMLEIARKANDPSHLIAAREREVRIWKGICNMIDFVANNRDEIDRIVRAREESERAEKAAKPETGEGQAA